MMALLLSGRVWRRQLRREAALDGLVVLLVLLSSPASSQPSFPVPPEVTSAQRSTMAKIAVAAKARSEAATPALLDFLGSSATDEVLGRCCPEMRSMNPEGRLSVLRALVQGSEIVHNLPIGTGPESPNYFTDQTIDLMLGGEFPWFLNEWQAGIVQNISKRAPPGIPYVDAEAAIFGCRPFGVGREPTWAEAADRLVYAQSNIRQADVGGYYVYGNVTAVFRTGYVEKNLLIAPMDTGTWEGSCNGSIGLKIKLNCSYWNPQSVGTFEFHDHLLLDHLGLWSGNDEATIYAEMEQMLARSAVFSKPGENLNPYETLPSLSWPQVLKYFETNLLMNPRLREGVKFLIPDFGYLFGTEAGRKVQRTADHYGWAVVWALGDGLANSFSPFVKFRGNNRLLDPTAEAAKTLNVTIGDNATREFERLWEEVAEMRVREEEPPSRMQVHGWWKRAEGKQIRLAPSSRFACESLDGCIGLDLDRDGDCVCYEHT